MNKTAHSVEKIEVESERIERVILNIPQKDILIITGDFNAKIGNTGSDDQLRNILRQYGIGERNQRGAMLIQFCTDNGLTIANTVFKHHPRRLPTCTCPSGLHKNPIDNVSIQHAFEYQSITNS